MQYYPAIIRKDRTSAFGVEFPDFPGCVTAGDDLSSALAEAEQALRFHVDGMLEDGVAVPEARPLETVLESADARGGAVYLVRLTPPRGRAVRVNITVEEALLDEIDTAAAESKTTRSGFLADAARLVLEREWERRLGGDPTAGGGRAIERLGAFVAKENKRRIRGKQPPAVGRTGSRR